MPIASAVLLEPIVPNCLGPSWQRTPEGGWLLPKHTLGWQIIAWAAKNLRSDEGGPWRFTPEQMRLLLWIYAVDEDGMFVYRDIVLQRMKGWGKDPFAAVLAAIEFVGPCRFHYWDGGEIGEPSDLYSPGAKPVAKDNPTAWVQIVAVSQEQTKNTASLLAGLFTEACRQKHAINLGMEKTYAYHGARRIEVTSSSWRSMEGNRPSFVIRNETHHWIAAVEGDKLASVIRRNLGKIKGGQARAISITNAYSPGENSLAENQRRQYMEVLEGSAIDTGVLYDSLEAPVGATLFPPYTRIDEDPEGQRYLITEVNEDGSPIPPSEEVIRHHIREILKIVRGDADWLDLDRLTNEILSGEESIENSKRFYFNSISLGDDASFNPEDIRATIEPEVLARRKGWEGDPLRVSWSRVGPKDPIVIFGDGSKSDDSTGLVGCRISDGYTFTIGVWEKPTGARGRTWTAPREEIDARFREAMGRFNVVAAWFDPSHAKDEEEATRYWDVLVDQWHQDFGDDLQMWAQKDGDRRSSIGWDMTSPKRQIDFVDAVERFTDELESHSFRHDGHPVLIKHLENCRRNMTTAGLSVSKVSKNSKNKIDLGVCAIGARMLRRVLMNKGLEKPKAGTVWYRT